MAGRKLKARTNGALTRARPALVAAGRALTAAVILLVASLIVVQFVRAIGQNVTAARQLSSLQADIATLEHKRDDQQRELRRLRDPEGAVPEIHDRLRLVRPNEAMVFISPAPAASAAP
jgi:cell division protein FtsB